MSTRTITFAGAGITGLWQALTLARRGHRVRLLERAAEPFALAASAYAGADPYPPMTQRSNVPPHGPHNVPLLDPQRMTPKSPRAALEPERVAMPTRS